MELNLFQKGPPGPIGPAGIPGHDGRPGVQGEAGTVGQPVSYIYIYIHIFRQQYLILIISVHSVGTWRATRRKGRSWTGWWTCKSLWNMNHLKLLIYVIIWNIFKGTERRSRRERWSRLYNNTEQRPVPNRNNWRSPGATRFETNSKFFARKYIILNIFHFFIFCNLHVSRTTRLVFKLSRF